MVEVKVRSRAHSIHQLLRGKKKFFFKEKTEKCLCFEPTGNSLQWEM